MERQSEETGTAGRRILVVDVGGNNVKFIISGDESRRKFPSGPGFTP